MFKVCLKRYSWGAGKLGSDYSLWFVRTCLGAILWTWKWLHCGAILAPLFSFSARKFFCTIWSLYSNTRYLFTNTLTSKHISNKAHSCRVRYQFLWNSLQNYLWNDISEINEAQTPLQTLIFTLMSNVHWPQTDDGADMKINRNKSNSIKPILLMKINQKSMTPASPSKINY